MSSLTRQRTLSHVSKMQLQRLFFAFAVLCLLSACVGTRTNDVEANAQFLVPQGWQNQNQLLQQSSFSDYARTIEKEVRQYRIPFNAEKAAQEIKMASPVERLPTERCGDSMLGIAILVHGLSDTAFAMQDIAKVLADACYTSRTVLLPGHGTRAGDLLTTRLSHWNATVTYLVEQATQETDTILLAGFSLGAVLTLNQSMMQANKVDGLIALSPAYYLSSYRLARWAPWARVVMPWIDRGVSDDAMRYEAMPTRGVAETVRAIQSLHKQVQNHGPIDIPWLLVQSVDDAVVVPEQNRLFWQAQAGHPDSQLIQLYSDVKPEEGARVLNILGADKTQGVIGLTHQAIHISPENTHYGIQGDYRNCGGTAPRNRELVSACQEAESVSYGLWNSQPPTGVPMAISTFNPAFDQLAAQIQAFAEKVAKSAR